MALLTKGQIRTAVAQALDDPTYKKWSQTNLDILITLVQDTMFEAIIDSFEYLTSQSEVLTPSGSGTVALSSLTKRFYRVQRLMLSAGSIDIQPKLFPENVPQQAYHIIGGAIETVPAATGVGSLTLRYSYMPTKFNDLANDATSLAVEYPDGHEAALIYLSAAWAMTKGDEESMQQIGRIADQSLESMLTHIARLYPIGANARVQQIKNTIMRNPIVTGVSNGAQ